MEASVQSWNRSRGFVKTMKRVSYNEVVRFVEEHIDNTYGDGHYTTTCPVSQALSVRFPDACEITFDGGVAEVDMGLEYSDIIFLNATKKLRRAIRAFDETTNFRNGVRPLSGKETLRILKEAV